MTMKVHCCCTGTFIDKDSDSFNKIYRDVDENKIKSLFRQYFATSSKPKEDYYIESTDTNLHSTYPSITIEDTIYPLSSYVNEQDKIYVQKAMLIFRKLFYSPNLHLASLHRPTTVGEFVIKAKLILAVEGPVDSLNVTQCNMMPTKACLDMENNIDTYDDTHDESLLLLSQNSFVHAATLSLNEDQKEKISWYDILTSWYLQDKSKDQILAISLTALLAAIIILLEETMDQNMLADIAVSHIFYKRCNISPE
jgi:hypothetical protein